MSRHPYSSLSCPVLTGRLPFLLLRVCPGGTRSRTPTTRRASNVTCPTWLCALRIWCRRRQDSLHRVSRTWPWSVGPGGSRTTSHRSQHCWRRPSSGSDLHPGLAQPSQAGSWEPRWAPFSDSSLVGFSASTSWCSQRQMVTFGDTVLFVGPNLLKMERDHAFRPDEFRFWVALHECTHRLQFTGVPWLRGYFLGLVEELVATAETGKRADPAGCCPTQGSCRSRRAADRRIRDLRGVRHSGAA